MPEPTLELRNLSVAIGQTPYVRDVSIALAPGEVFGLLGPNGAGKTTLLRTLYHAARPSAGEILLHGRAQADWPRRDWSRAVGALVQSSGLLAGLTPVDIVDIGLRPLGLTRAENDTRLDAALRLVGLTEQRDQSAESLSGGELQRCYFAQLLARDPELYILDEPTNHLDLHYQLRLLDEVRARGKTALATFHDLAIAARYCDRVAVMEQGRVVAMGPVQEVLTRDRLIQSYRVEAELINGALYLERPVLD